MTEGNDPLGILTSSKQSDPLGILEGEPSKKKVPSEPGASDSGSGSEPSQSREVDSIYFQWAEGSPVESEKFQQRPETEELSVGGKSFEVPKSKDLTSYEVAEKARQLFKQASPIKIETPANDPLFGSLSKAVVKGNEAPIKQFLDNLDVESRERLTQTKVSDEESLEILYSAYKPFLDQSVYDMSTLRERGVDKAAEDLNKRTKELESVAFYIDNDKKTLEALQKQKGTEKRQQELITKINENVNLFNSGKAEIERLATPELMGEIDQYQKASDTYRDITGKIQKAKFSFPEILKKEGNTEALNAFVKHNPYLKSYDLAAKTWNGLSSAVGDLFSGLPKMAGGLSTEYSPSDKTAESISNFFSNTLTMPTTETKTAGQGSPQFKPFYDAEIDKINWSALPDEIANQAGAFAVLAATGMGGKIAGMSDAASIVLPGYLLSYNDAYKTGKGIYGEDATSASTYAMGSAFITGVTELIMPDRDIISSKLVSDMGKVFVQDFVKGGKNYAMKQAMSEVMRKAGGEVTEEMADRWKDVLLNGIVNVTGGDIALDIPSLNEQLSIIASTAALTGIASGGAVRKDASNIRRAAIYQGAQNLPETLTILSNLEKEGYETAGIVEEVQKMAESLKLVPEELSTPKKIAVAEKLTEAQELEQQNASGISPIIVSVNEKKVNEIQGEIAGIIDDKKFDEKFEEDVQKELSAKEKIEKGVGDVVAKLKAKEATPTMETEQVTMPEATSESQATETNSEVSTQVEGENIPTLETLLQDGNVIKGDGKELRVEFKTEGQTKKILLHGSDGSIGIVPLKSDGTIPDYIKNNLDYLIYANTSQNEQKETTQERLNPQESGTGSPDGVTSTEPVTKEEKIADIEKRRHDELNQVEVKYSEDNIDPNTGKRSLTLTEKYINAKYDAELAELNKSDREADKPIQKPTRFESGKKLSPEEKKKVLSTLQDSYKTLKRPYTIEDTETGERRVYLDSQSDYMVVSDITGQRLRHYITLPDGKIAHPSELYPNVSRSEVLSSAKELQEKQDAKDRATDKATKRLISTNTMGNFVMAIKAAQDNGFTLREDGSLHKEGLKFNIPFVEYAINAGFDILGLTEKDLNNYRIGKATNDVKRLIEPNSEIDWNSIYNSNKTQTNEEKTSQERLLAPPQPEPTTSPESPVTEVPGADQTTPVSEEVGDNSKIINFTPDETVNQGSQPGESGKTNRPKTKGEKSKTIGIGRGRLPKNKRQVRNPVHKRAIETETNRPIDRVLQFFIRGGKIQTSVIEQIFGGGGKNIKGERRARIGITNNSTGFDTVDALAHSLWENQQNPGQYESTDFRDAVLDVISGHNSTGTMIRDLLESLEGTDSQEFQAMMSGRTSEEIDMFEEMTQADEYWSSLTEEQAAEFVKDYDANTALAADDILAEESRVEESKPESKKERGKRLIDEGVSAIVSKAGGKKNITPQERTTILEDLRKIIEGVVELGEVKLEEAVKQLIATLRRQDVFSKEDVDFFESELTPKEAKESSTPPPPKAEPAEDKPKRRKKALLNRAYDGTTEELQPIIAEYGFDYIQERHEDTKQQAQAFINDVGEQAALFAVQNNQMDGAVKAFIWAELIDRAEAKMATATGEERVKLTAHVASLVNQFDLAAREGGRFISALGNVYKTSDFKYRIERLIKDFTEANNGESLSADLQKKLLDISEELSRVNAELKANQEKIAQMEEQIAFEKIQAEVKQTMKSPKVSGKAKVLADKIRQGKLSKKGIFMAASPASIVWDGAIEIVATSIEAGAKLAEAIEKGLKYIKSSAWYKGLTAPDKAMAESAYAEHWKKPVSDAQVDVTDEGKLFIPKSLLTDLIESGIDNIDDLTSAVHALFSEKFTDITLRQVRDAITEYGKQRMPSKDETLRKLSELKRDGKLLSGLEDALSGKAPLRSGYQRPKPTDSQRELMRKIQDAIKLLPEDAADVERKFATAQDRIKRLLENRIADLNKQIEKGERETRTVKRTTLNAENEALRAEVESLNKQLDDLVGKKELTYEQRVNNSIAAAERALKELNERLATGDLAHRVKQTLAPTPELSAIREQVKQKRTELNEMRKAAGVAEARRIELYEKKIKKDIAELQERLQTGNFDKKVRPEPVELNREQRRLEAERLRLKEEVEVEREKLRLKNRTAVEKAKDTAIDVLNIPRSIAASLDLSSLLRQGIILGARHPIMVGQSMAEGVRFAFNEKRYNDYLRSIKSSPEYVTMKKAGLYLSEPSSKLQAKEEQFMSNIVHKIPILGDLVKASERAYTGQLNKLRVDVFMDFQNTLERDGITGKELERNLKSFAAFINQATGRGNLGATLNQSAPLLNAAFFAPRFVASRVNLLGRVLTAGGVNMPRAARMEAIKSLLAYTGLGMTILALAAASGADVDDDPTSSNFGKIKIGNVTFDIWAGLQQVVVLLSRIGFQRVTDPTTGEQIPFDTGGFNEKNMWTVLTNFAESKVSPPTAIALEVMRGENKYDKSFFGMDLGKRGDPVTVQGEVLNTLQPIWQQDVWDIAEKEGAGMAVGAGLASFMGVGMQHYDPEPRKQLQRQVYDKLIETGGKRTALTDIVDNHKDIYKDRIRTILKLALTDETAPSGFYKPGEGITEEEKQIRTAFMDVVKKAEALYYIRDKPAWYRDVFYAGLNDLKEQSIRANTTDSNRKEILKKLVENHIISDNLQNRINSSDKNK